MANYQRGDVLIKTLPQRISDGTYRGLVLVTAHSSEAPFEAGYSCDVTRDKANEALQDADIYVAMHHPSFAHRRPVSRL